MQKLIKQLQIHIRARYPVLYLLSFEEARLQKSVEHVAKQENLQLCFWRRTVGLNMSGELIADTKNAEDALAAFASFPDPVLGIFWDLHLDLFDPSVIRWIRDLCLKMGSLSQTLLIVSPKMIIPDELEKSITVLDIPLPSESDGSRLLQVLCDRQKITLDSSLFQRFVRGALGLTEEEIKRLYSRILLSGNRFSESDLSLQVEEKRRIIRKSRFLEFWDVQDLPMEIGGMENLKKWLLQRQNAFSKEAQAFGLPQPKGLFLLGVQGCGKSLMAKVVAKSWNLPLLGLDVSVLFQRSVEEGLRETIRIAESMAPAVLWIDELEKGFAQKEGSGDALGIFLTWMQEKTKPIFVIATANDVRSLPPELLRKGRFDEIFFVDLPDVHDRLEIMDIHLRRRARDPANFDLTVVVEETELFSGAELEQVVISGLFNAFSESRELDTIDLLESAREIIPLALTMDDQLKDLREWARPRARRAASDRRRVDFFADWED
ncbi:MAG: AAA family ATPase [Myxococcota bacterium]|nr:AAA family ATPase [Myxococcota bacterium]